TSPLRRRSGARAIDGTDKTLVPGLIDAHVYTMGSPDFLRSALALGVTTEIDMGAAPQFAVQVERDQAAGKDLDLADLRSSGTQPTAPYGHPTQRSLGMPTTSGIIVRRVLLLLSLAGCSTPVSPCAPTEQYVNPPSGAPTCNDGTTLCECINTI